MISGRSFRAVEAAVAELKCLGLNIDGYRIFVGRKDSIHISGPHQRASSAGMESKGSPRSV